MDSGNSRNDLSTRHRLFRERGLRYSPRRVITDVIATPASPIHTAVKQKSQRITPQAIPALPRQQKAKVLARTHRSPLSNVRTPISDVAAAQKTSVAPPKVAAPALPRQRKSQVLARRISGKAASYQKQAAQSRRRLQTAFAGGAALVLVVIGSGVVIFGQFEKAPETQATVPATLGATTINGGIDEAPVSTDAVMSHTGQATDPVRISIPRVGVISRIFGVSADQTGQPVPSENIYDFGWLKTSGTPGNGVMVLNGYQNGPTKTGSLEQIKVLAAGDVVQVERGDGQQIKYVITKTQSYAADAIDVAAFVASADSTKPSLVMLTNQGRFSIRENRFESRTVVWAVNQQ